VSVHVASAVGAFGRHERNKAPRVLILTVVVGCPTPTR
jgi:hypothetical protein